MINIVLHTMDLANVAYHLPPPSPPPREKERIRFDVGNNVNIHKKANKKTKTNKTKTERTEIPPTIVCMPRSVASPEIV